MAARFWVGGTGTWDLSDTTHWSATSGGAGGQSVPTSADTVTFDGGSGGGTVTTNADVVGNAVSMGAFAGTLDFSIHNNNPTFLTFSGSGTGVRSLKMGDGTWTIGVGSSSNVWQMSITTNLVFNAGNSTIKLSDTTNNVQTFVGGGLTYHDIWWSRSASTGNITVSGNNTFADFKDDGIAAHSLLFTAGTTQHVTTFTVGNNATAIVTITSAAGSTSTHALVKDGGGTISTDYLNIQHSVATPSSTWYAGLNSTDNQAVATAGSGWLFIAAPINAVLTAVVGSFVVTGENATLTFTLSPVNYVLSAVAGSFVLSGEAVNLTLAATLTLTYTAGPHGSISGSTPQTVVQGSNGTPVTAVPAATYVFFTWSDGSEANPRTDRNVQSSISVTATFGLPNSRSAKIVAAENRVRYEIRYCVVCRKLIPENSFGFTKCSSCNEVRVIPSTAKDNLAKLMKGISQVKPAGMPKQVSAPVIKKKVINPIYVKFDEQT